MSQFIFDPQSFFLGIGIGIVVLGIWVLYELHR